MTTSNTPETTAFIDINGFTANVNTELRKHYEKDSPKLVEMGMLPQVRAQAGPKFWKIICFESARSESGSAYCFVEKATGNILKSASWKAPAKGVRGNISDPNYGWGKAVGLYGAAYLR
jgi:hypothetical protein